MQWSWQGDHYIAPNTQMYTQLDLQDGYIVTNEKMETSIPGVYAAGDIRVKQVRQVATAVSDGAIAAINASLWFISILQVLTQTTLYGNS